MKVAIVGYGKMGRMIEKTLIGRSHECVCTVDLFASDASCITSDRAVMADAVKKSGAEGVVEFSHPASVVENIRALLPLRIPLVVGTTGWRDSLEEVTELVSLNKTSLLYASNFSIGVNLFYRTVSAAAAMISRFESEYDPAVFEVHHNQKADSPSGTGIDIARRVMEHFKGKTRLVTDSFTRKPESSELHLASLRAGSMPGTHTVIFDSPADTIELTHTARNREGFASGAVHALEWLCRPDSTGRVKSGVFTMDDVLDSIFSS